MNTESKTETTSVPFWDEEGNMVMATKITNFIRPRTLSSASRWREGSYTIYCNGEEASVNKDGTIELLSSGKRMNPVAPSSQS